MAIHFKTLRWTVLATVLLSNCSILLTAEQTEWEMPPDMDEIVLVDTTRPVMRPSSDPKKRGLEATCEPPKVPCADNSFCHDPSTDVCTSFGVCPKQSMPCAGQCINTAEKVCVENKVACPKDQFQICGPKNECYNPNEKTCFGGKELCKDDEELIDGECSKRCDRPCYKDSCDTSKGHLDDIEKNMKKLNALDQVPGRLKELDGIVLAFDSTGKTTDDKLAKLESVIKRLEEGGPQPPPSEQCASQCANNECYNPKEKTCHPGGILCSKNDEFKEGKCVPKPPPKDPNTEHPVCPSGQQVCGQSCYDPSAKTCDSGNVCNKPENPVTCPTCKPNNCPDNKLPCGETCYSPSNQDCQGGNVVAAKPSANCPSGQQQCGQACYNPSSQACNTGTVNVVCDADENLQNGKCEKPSEPPSTTCPTGQEFCGGKCFNPQTTSCFSGPPAPACSGGMAVCGANCYSIASHNCNPGYVICRVGEQARGGRCTAKKACGAKEQMCGSSCYDPEHEICSNGLVSPVPTGVEVCEDHEQQCGEKCFDPKRQSCNNGQVNSASNCPKGEEVCGDICYNPNTLNCASGQTSAVCPSGLSPCGPNCYVPSGYACGAGHVVTPTGS